MLEWASSLTVAMTCPVAGSAVRPSHLPTTSHWPIGDAGQVELYDGAVQVAGPSWPGPAGRRHFGSRRRYPPAGR